MRHSLRLAGLLTLSLGSAHLVACGDDTSGNGGAGGSASSTTAVTATSTGTGGSGQGGGGKGGSGGGGAGPCTADECTCCLENGGVCGDSCSATQSPNTLACEYPDAPAENQFLCDGWLPCTRDQICTVSSPAGDGCSMHACEAAPAACVDDVSCACVTEALGVSASNCVDQEDGGVRVQVH